MSKVTFKSVYHENLAKAVMNEYEQRVWQSRGGFYTKVSRFENLPLNCQQEHADIALAAMEGKDTIQGVALPEWVKDMVYGEGKTVDKKALQDFVDAWRGILKEEGNDTAERMLSDLVGMLLPPKTMNDVEWESEVHHLMEANHSVYGKVVMLCENFTDDSFIYCVDGQGSVLNTPKDRLTPTGKKFKLYPDVAEETPQVKALFSLADYQNAGVGTLVRAGNNGLTVFEKRGKDEWRDFKGFKIADESMAYVTREVLSGVEQ